jgi:hypothetical protein
MLSFRSAAASERTRIEAPMSWFAVGHIVSLVALAWLGHVSFGMPVWQSVSAVALSFLLALVACRVTGETDTTTVNAMGKIAQRAFAKPRATSIQLDERQYHGRIGDFSADLLTDLKSGYLLGANPRQQFLASSCWHLCRRHHERAHVCGPGAKRAGARRRPVPNTWSAVAIALGRGQSSLEAIKLWLIFACSVVGAALTLAPVLLPKHQDYLLSA